MCETAAFPDGHGSRPRPRNGSIYAACRDILKGKDLRTNAEMRQELQKHGGCMDSKEALRRLTAAAP